MHHRALECKSRNQAIPGVAGNFGLGVQNEVGQRLAVLSGEDTGHSKHPFQQPKR